MPGCEGELPQSGGGEGTVSNSSPQEKLRGEAPGRNGDRRTEENDMHCETGDSGEIELRGVKCWISTQRKHHEIHEEVDACAEHRAPNRRPSDEEPEQPAQ